MTFETLAHVLFPIFDENQIEDIWNNPSNNIEYNDYKKFLQVNPENFGFTFVCGKISASGVMFKFKAENYELTMYPRWDYFKRNRYEYALLHPNFRKEHYEGRKRGITMSSVKIENDKDFKAYLSRISKRFPF